MMCLLSNSGLLLFAIRLSRRLLIDRYYRNVAASFIQKWRRRLRVFLRIMPRSEPLYWLITWNRLGRILKQLNRICALRFGSARTNVGGGRSRLFRGSQTASNGLGG